MEVVKQLTPREEAEKELKLETQRAAVRKIKAKLEQIQAAEKVVSNFKHELEVLEKELAGE